MPTMTAKYDSGDVEVTFTAQTEKADYGVPGSPVWDDILTDTIEVEDVTILGVSVPMKDMWPPLRRAIEELSDEVEWENA